MGCPQLADVLAPEEPDIVIEGKRGLDAFASTNLDFILRARGITTLALGGFLINCPVGSTMRTCYEKGYDVIALTECTTTVSPSFPLALTIIWRKSRKIRPGASKNVAM